MAHEVRAGSALWPWASAGQAGTVQIRPAVRLGSGWEAPALLLGTVALVSFGVVAVYSASSVLAQTRGLPNYYFVVRQAMGGAFGLVLLALVAQFDYRRLQRLAWPLLLASTLLLLLLVLPFTHAIAPVINGARRWLFLGPVSLQPAEMAKLAVIIWTAALAVRKQDRLPSLTRGLLPFLLIWGVVELLIILQPNFSSAVIILLLASLVVFAGGARIGHFLLLGVIGLPLLWVMVEGAAYRLSRIVAFLEMGDGLEATSYQINQSLIALGSGGLLGRGLGRGQQKFGFLPEAHNDFIFAMIGEEWGLLGALALIVLFAGFAVVGYRIARRSPDLFGYLLAVGVTNLIVVQALLHMAVNTNLVPTTGVSLPFLSYGRSNLLASMAGVGILLNVARAGEPRPQPVGERRRGLLSRFWRGRAEGLVPASSSGHHLVSDRLVSGSSGSGNFAEGAEGADRTGNAAVRLIRLPDVFVAPSTQGPRGFAARPPGSSVPGALPDLRDFRAFRGRIRWGMPYRHGAHEDHRVAGRVAR
jgi:cell division protein FtsW